MVIGALIGWRFEIRINFLEVERFGSDVELLGCLKLLLFLSGLRLD